MSANSDHVKQWRKRTKERLVEAFGGKCCVCNYDKWAGNMCFHHLDPSIKESAAGGYRANIRSWATIVEEMRKCVLICVRCHAEIHAGISKIPPAAPRFNESFSEYRPPVDASLQSPCPVCGVSKLIHAITCSRACAAKRARRIDWDKIDIKEELKTKSMVALAEQLGVSEAAVRKHQRKTFIASCPER